MLLKVDIQRVLVLQAAHQPPARAGDPHGVDGEILVLRHPDCDRFEVLQERGTAQVAAAWADTALQLRLVPGADLPELDLRAQTSGQVADESPEIDSMWRAEVDDQLPSGRDVVDSDDL